MNVGYTYDDKEMQAALADLQGEAFDKAQNAMLVAASEVLEKNVSELSSPRSKGDGRNRVYKRKTKPGHILDFMSHNAPRVIGVAKAIETGVNLDNTYAAGNQGFGYAVPLTYGTSKMRAQPFLEPTLDRSQEAMVDAMAEELKRGLGL